MCVIEPTHIAYDFGSTFTICLAGKFEKKTYKSK